MIQRFTQPRRMLAGFTLLEVMIAVVILAVGLSALFTSEAGAIRLAQRARTTTIATLLARCKMAEIEEKIAKEGWPVEEIEDSDECCDEGEHEGFKCDWKVERIKLPESEDDESKDDDGKGTSSKSNSKSPFGGGGMLDALSGLSKQENGAKMSSITDFLSGGGTNVSSSVKKGDRAPGDSDKDKEKEDQRNPEGKDRPKKQDGEDNGDVSGTELDPMASMVMGIAFPMLRPVIEEGTRRASVVVRWKEGSSEQQFEVVQFMVSEKQIILPDVDDDDGGVSSPSSTPTAGSTSTSTSSGTTSTAGGK